jgi:L-alanine-DL-glutamate epimerase-like enolase superfamily enzyme
MLKKRRDFLKSAVLLTGAAVATGGPYRVLVGSNNVHIGNSGMKLKYHPYTLQQKHVFTISTNSRSTTPVVLTEIEYGGVTGYGEASLPPYLGESQQSVVKFLSAVDLSKYETPFEAEDILTDLDTLAPANTAAKASVDIALHDLIGKLMGQPWYNIWGYDRNKTPYTSFTIGIDTAQVVKEKTKEAQEYKILKVKLGRDNDREMIEAIRSVSDRPLTGDVNQGWTDKEKALEMLHWLKDKGMIMIEQPLPKERLEDLAWLKERSPIPIIGDEGVQRLSDVRKAAGVYDGINIKLMKCTGMREAHKMLTLARSLDMKVMLGCMIETSCAISAAAQLSPMADWADLDGALLIKNDPFDGVKIVDGKITLDDSPGIGIRKL